jgi:hypothetical protein
MSQAPLASGSTIDAILHALVILGISAASIFVKNPNSQQHAVSIINLVQTEVLPLADALLNPPAAATPPAN